MNKKAKATEFATDVYSIEVTGRNVLVTDAMKDYAIEKVGKIEKFTDRIIDVHVMMDIQKIEHRVDIIMRVGHIKIKSSASSNDMYVSIDQAVDKLEKQLRRYKSRIQDHHAKKLSVVDMTVNVLRSGDLTIEVNDQIEEENNRELEEVYKPHEIVSEEKHPLKMLTSDEAVMKMDLSGDVFLIFRCEEDQKLKVIYRRNDGNYGIIHVES
ncbi:MAG: ribosome-associated translation inhibitor RaiA [Chlamydiales bacterium]|nr:ribosome-associated translation inhibitor RaiA [Chlamydiia bacterium]MCP5506990.1 ribosome-associated translation inhibitor RaiA [Chlamydiales bacterium]